MAATLLLTPTTPARTFHDARVLVPNADPLCEVRRARVRRRRKHARGLDATLGNVPVSRMLDRDVLGEYSDIRVVEIGVEVFRR